MASLGSSIRSAARATFSAYRSVPIRWRLAGGSAALTLVILAAFAAIVGVLTDRQVRTQFNDEVELGGRPAPAGAQQQARVHRRRVRWTATSQQVHLSDYASAEHAQIRIFDRRRQLLCTQDEVPIKGAEGAAATAALFATPPSQTQAAVHRDRLPRRRARQLSVTADRLRRAAALRAARCPTSTTRSPGSASSCCSGVLGGTVLALLAGLATRPASDAPDRRADRRRAGDRADPRPQPADPPPRGRRRGRRAGPNARGHARARSTRRAATPRRCSTASASSSPTPRTSCARR